MDEGQMRSAFRWSIWLCCAYIVLVFLFYVFQPQVKLVLGAPAEIVGLMVGGWNLGCSGLWRTAALLLLCV